MMKCYFTLVVMTMAVTISVKAQFKAKAISYSLVVDLAKLGGAEKGSTSKYEVDLYYTPEKVRTNVRVISNEFGLTIMQRLYDVNAQDEYNINHDERHTILKKELAFTPKPTGKQKTILGYVCKEYTVTDYRKITFTIWVTDKLGKNVCPAGNFSLPGTALEVESSSGLHFTATDFAEGQLDATFFNPPTGYEEEIIMPPTPEAKK